MRIPRAIKHAPTVAEGSDRFYFAGRHAGVDRNSPCIELAQRQNKRDHLQAVFSDQRHAVAGTNTQPSQVRYRIKRGAPESAIAEPLRTAPQRRAVGIANRPIMNDMT